MNPEERQLLEKTYELTQENNRLLHKVRRSAALANVMNFIYYGAIIGLPIVLYYFVLQPYVGQALDYYKQIQSGGEQVQSIGTEVKTNPNIQSILENLGITP